MGNERHHSPASDAFAWFLNVSSAVTIVFVNKVLMDKSKGYAFTFGKYLQLVDSYLDNLQACPTWQLRKLLLAARHLIAVCPLLNALLLLGKLVMSASSGSVACNFLSSAVLFTAPHPVFGLQPAPCQQSTSSQQQQAWLVLKSWVWQKGPSFL